jgi:hypothetical protein
MKILRCESDVLNLRSGMGPTYESSYTVAQN